MALSAVEPVSVSRRIEAPADVVFAVLTHPEKHPDIDGSGMLREAVGDPVVSRVGDTFTIVMHTDEMGDYEMTNYVVDFVPGQRIAWEPEMSAASRAEDQEMIGVRAHHRWSYELRPDGPDGTLVIETYDCTQAPERLQKVVKGGHRWEAAMKATLENLEQRCAGRARPSS